MGDKSVFDGRCPKAYLDQIANQVFVYADELAGEHSPCVHICSEWLETLVVSQNLGSRSSWHRGKEERVSGSVLLHVCLKLSPVISF